MQNVFGTLALGGFDTLSLCVSEVRRTGYLEELAVYAERYGVSLRTVKRWAVKKPPFDEPGKMAGWWAKNMTQRVPDSISGAAVHAVQQETEEAVELPAAAPTVLLPVGDDEVGVQATQKRLRNAEVLANRKYLEALERNDAGEIRAALRNWNDISAQVRTMTKVARDDELARRELISRTVAEAALVEVHQPIVAGFRGMFGDICRAYGIADTAENALKWSGLVDGVCAVLSKEVFGECE